jgi:hypothetical protein
LPAILPIFYPGLFRYQLKFISKDLSGMLHKKLNKKFDQYKKFD